MYSSISLHIFFPFFKRWHKISNPRCPKKSLSCKKKHANKITIFFSTCIIKNIHILNTSFYFDSMCTSWRFFQIGVVRTKADIYVFKICIFLILHVLQNIVTLFACFFLQDKGFLGHRGFEILCQRFKNGKKMWKEIDEYIKER
jgi:hypothetical protein